MSSLPGKSIVDTNVPLVANLAKDPLNISDDLVDCVDECIEAIEHVTSGQGRLVIDDGNEIFDEYRKKLSLSGQSGVGDRFMKWVHDHQYLFADQDRVSITKTGGSYAEFPEHDDLHAFDRSDRKFVAVANAHPDKPPILEATDSKWWGWSTALANVGITVIFLCPDYAKEKYQQKMVQDDQ